MRFFRIYLEIYKNLIRKNFPPLYHEMIDHPCYIRPAFNAQGEKL